MKQYYVYVLMSLKDKLYYIGYTSDINRRIKQHMSGKVISTKWRLPIKLTYYEMHLNQKDALRREDYFKTSPGKRTLKMMLREQLKSE